MNTKLDITVNEAEALENYLSHLSNFHKTVSYIENEPFYTNPGRIDMPEKDYNQLLKILERLQKGNKP